MYDRVNNEISLNLNTDLNKIVEKYKDFKFAILVLYDYSPLSKKLLQEMEKIQNLEIFFEYYDKEEPMVVFLRKGKIIERIRGLVPKEVVEELVNIFHLDKEKLEKKLKEDLKNNEKM